ncbi:DUF896 domain-containing protein [Paenibacillus xerothermodurans]|uniref:UPF0291 protein CBW46_005375 n=1 Tax=Paenibacillus xerothermodurans TaxID=1977292 RepID=A0A2W1NVU4_PAEXE|nr:DUF896 domain-containing protein [Paenibacillus xerothermodurans]PZE21836.1 DUF896 family protein [Paenibacillus xerothermodurans]
MSNETQHEQDVKRINELARKAKAEGLTEAELEERAVLRKRYIEGFKTSVRDQLDNITIVDGDEKRK